MSYDLGHLQQAVSAHLKHRSIAWVDDVFPLYDGPIAPLVQHLTISKMLALEWLENALFCGCAEFEKRREATLEMVYVISRDFNPKDKRAFARWLKKHRKINLDECLMAMPDYTAKQFGCSISQRYDNPENTSKPAHEGSLFDQISAIVAPLKSNHYAAHFYSLFHHQYGWSRERTFSTPLPQLHLLEIEIINSNMGEKAPTVDQLYIDSYLRYKQDKAKQ